LYQHVFQNVVNIVGVHAVHHALGLRHHLFPIGIHCAHKSISRSGSKKHNTTFLRSGWLYNSLLLSLSLKMLTCNAKLSFLGLLPDINGCQSLHNKHLKVKCTGATCILVNERVCGKLLDAIHGSFCVFYRWSASLTTCATCLYIFNKGKRSFTFSKRLQDNQFINSFDLQNKCRYYIR